MSNEPSYPKDADVQGGASGTSDASSGKSDPKRKKQYVKAGVAVGIGSAAIVAALLYANRSKRGDS
jgi:hypothetical protein